MIYKTLRCLVVVGNTTREPSEAEARAIVTHLESEHSSGMLGVWPVPHVGDVWFLVNREAAVAPIQSEEITPTDDLTP
jgi:hypothetical protein